MINKLDTVLQKGHCLNIFFTAGYPTLDSIDPIIRSLDAEGVEIIEIGMPYSDPLADGPTIQHSSEMALQNGLTLPLLFEEIGKARLGTSAVFIMMGYLNQLMQFGVENFLSEAQKAGVEALIIPDLPPKVYRDEYQEVFEKYDIKICFLITPQTSVERIQLIDELTTGFIYIVSSSAITGQKGSDQAEKRTYFERIKAMNLTSRTMVGFGISTKEDVEFVCDYADGAIIGSAFIKSISNQEKELTDQVQHFIKTLK